MRELASITFKVGMFNADFFARRKFYVAFAYNWVIKLGDLVAFG